MWCRHLNFFFYPSSTFFCGKLAEYYLILCASLKSWLKKQKKKKGLRNFETQHNCTELLDCLNKDHLSIFLDFNWLSNSRFCRLLLAIWPNKIIYLALGLFHFHKKIRFTQQNQNLVCWWAFSHFLESLRERIRFLSRVRTITLCWI